MNIKQFVRSVINVPDIINLTASKTVYFLKADNETPTYITYQIFDENGEFWAEGKEIATTYYVQVDVFSKSDYTTLEEKVKEKMINAGFSRSMCADLYESDTKLFHKAMRFLITKNI